MKLSFTIPCYRSSQTIKNVIDEIETKMLERPDYDYEIIAVNDCSPDNTWEVLSDIANNNKRLKILNFTKNKGKHTALLAAYRHSTGDIIVGVDDDMQSPVSRLWDLIEPILQGYDVSIAKYPVKKQSRLKSIGSKINDLMVRKLMDKPKGLVFSNFIARKKYICDAMSEYKNPFPYLEGLTLQITNNIAQVPMEGRERQAGESGYNFKRSLMLLLDGFTAFSVKPLRFTSYLGFLFSIIGLLIAIVTVINKFLHPKIQVGYSSLMAVLSISCGIILILLGVLGEYIGRIYISLNEYPQYVIKDKKNFEVVDTSHLDEGI